MAIPGIERLQRKFVSNALASDFGLIGPGYQSQSLAADGERSVNLYLEAVESGHGVGPALLAGTPGLASFCALPQSGPIRALQSFPSLAIDQFGNVGETLYAVAGSDSGGGPVFYEIGSNGAHTARGTISGLGSGETVAGVPVYLASNGQQILISATLDLWLYDVVSHAFTAVTNSATTGGFPLGPPVFLDGYFILPLRDSNKFLFSALNDGTSWNSLDFGRVTGALGNIVGLLADHRLLWFFKERSTEVWYNSGGATNPLIPYPGGFIEQGCSAESSPAKLDNSVFWLGGDERGALVAWRAQGFIPVRISNHAVERIWQDYQSAGQKVSDAIGFAYQEGGHSFYVIYFPSVSQTGEDGPIVGATWVYDVATNQWHERAWWDGAAYHAHLARCHAFCYGKHFIGSNQSPTIYEQNAKYFDDEGHQIRRLRSSPHLNLELKWMRYSKLVIDAEVGVGNDVQPNPTLTMEYSDDGGFTWKNPQARSLGAAGETRKRVRWRRLGRSANRCFRVWTTDAVKIALVNAYLDATPGDGA